MTLLVPRDDWLRLLALAKRHVAGDDAPADAEAATALAELVLETNDRVRIPRSTALDRPIRDEHGRFIRIGG